MTGADEALTLVRRQLIRGFLFALLISFFISILHLTVPLFMLQVYDRVLNSRSLETLTMLVIVAVGALGVFAVLEYIRGRVFHILAQSISLRLGRPALQAAVGQSLRGQNRESGQAVRDLGEIHGLLSSTAASAPLELLWSPLFLLVLFLLHPLYGAIAIGSALILLLFGAFADLATRTPNAEARQASGQLIADMTAATRHAEVIEGMGMLPALVRRWRPTQCRMLAMLDRGNAHSKAISSASRSARFTMQVATLATGAALVIQHTVTPGTLIAASVIMGRLLMPFEQLIESWRRWALAYTAYDRIREALANGRGGRNQVALPRPAGHLKVDQLVYMPTNRDRPLLKGLSFSLEPGEVLGVTGPSAVGKSTLARLLVGVVAPTAGRVYLDGHCVFQWEREDFGGIVGYLPQNVSLLNGTIRANIARMSDADPALVIEAARAAGVHEIIGRLPFGYETPIGENGTPLSAGQQQRIGLARALFGSPRLIVLDEPNANLDFEGEQALLRAIRRAAEGGATVILISHRPSVMAVSDKLLVLKDGTIEQFGPRAEVLKSITLRPQVVQGDPGARDARPVVVSRSGS
jgi:ATP-binding cassette subfamily C protein